MADTQLRPIRLDRVSAVRRYDSLCDVLDRLDEVAQQYDFRAVRSAVATQRVLLRRDLGLGFEGEVVDDGSR